MRITTLVFATALLAGCFGGGGEQAMPAAADPLAAVPAAVSTSAAATVDGQTQLAARNDSAEQREPIDLTGVSLATSDTTEPIALN